MRTKGNSIVMKKKKSLSLKKKREKLRRLWSEISPLLFNKKF